VEVGDEGHDEVDEDGDLIDYEDEEFEQAHKAAISGGRTDTGTAEDEAVADLPPTDETETAANTEHEVERGDGNGDDYDEYDVGYDDAPTEVDDSAEHYESERLEVAEDDDDESEIGYDQELENLESLESNESENTLVGDDSSRHIESEGIEEAHDEIDYDDDDHLDLGDNFELSAKESSVPNGHTRKRSREAEDTVDETLKESKRPRS